MPFLVNYKNKGLILFFLYGNSDSIEFYKYYLDSACDSFDFTVREINKKFEFSFDEHITGGMDLNSKFQIIKFGNSIKLYKNNKLIKPGKTEYNQKDKFEIEVDYPLSNNIIKFKIPNSEYTCKVNLFLFNDKIKILQRIESCIRKKDKEINDIIEHNLNERKLKNIEFYIKFQNPITDDELIYSYNSKKFKCEKKDKVYVICKPKIPKELLIKKMNSKFIVNYLAKMRFL